MEYGSYVVPAYPLCFPPRGPRCRDGAGEHSWLYDLHADPGEAADQAAARPDKLRELRARLAEWAALAAAALVGPTRPPTADELAAAQPTPLGAAMAPVGALQWRAPVLSRLCVKQ